MPQFKKIYQFIQEQLSLNDSGRHRHSLCVFQGNRIYIFNNQPYTRSGRCAFLSLDRPGVGKGVEWRSWTWCQDDKGRGQVRFFGPQGRGPKI